MKALTLWQPWAHAVAHLGKRVENRTWAPPLSLLGEDIAIHGGKRLDREVAEEWGLRTDEIALGCVVAVATLIGFVGRREDLPELQRLWWSGPVGWLLDDVMAIEPVPCRGAQGLWDLPAEAKEAVLAAVQRAGGRS